MAVGYNNYKIKAEKVARSSRKDDGVCGFTVRTLSGGRMEAKTLKEAISMAGDNRARIIRNRDSVVVWKR